MSNHIGNKIDDIFSDELNYNRKSNLLKPSSSNKFVRKKFKEDKNRNYELIRQFNRQIEEEEGLFKENSKLYNEINENDISLKKEKKHSNKEENNIIKKIMKKTTQEIKKNYLKDHDFIINNKDLENMRISSYHPKNNKDLESSFKGASAKDSKKIKKTKFMTIEKKSEEKKNENNKNNGSKLKRKKTNKKKGGNIVMIEKQKYPKKETIFDRIKLMIKEANNEEAKEENVSVKKKLNKNTSLKSRKLGKPIKRFDSVRTKKPNSNIKKWTEQKLDEENDSSNFIKSNIDLINNDSINSKNKTIKTNKSKNSGIISKNYIKNSENDFFQSSKFSNESDSKEDSKDSEDKKDDIFLSKECTNNKNKTKSSRRLRKVKMNPEKIVIKNTKTFNLYDNKSNKKGRNSNESGSNNNSENNSQESNNNNSNDQKDSDEDNSINKKFKYTYNHGEGVLSIIPEQDNKKRFFEDINQNIDIMKPENIITLDQNYNKDKNISRNLEFKKNNIIINNNVSNNITVHKKESPEKKEEIKKGEETNKENNQSNKKGKPYKVKARKKFPFCCL